MRAIQSNSGDISDVWHLLDNRIDKFNLLWIPGHCSNLEYLRVTCVILSNFCHFSQLFFINTHCVISSIFVALSIFFSSSQPFLSTHFYVIYASYNCTFTTHQTTQLSLPSCWAHILCANTSFQLWPPCHSDLGRSRHGLEFSTRTTKSVTPPRDCRQWGGGNLC